MRPDGRRQVARQAGAVRAGRGARAAGPGTAALLKAVLFRPETLLAGTFGGLIAAGTLLLSLPVAHAGERVSVLDAFFTSTSAACITGLITVDTATRYSRFGQGTILVLCQLGGLGIMTFAALAAQLFRLRISFSSQAAWHRALFDGEARINLRQALRHIFLLTLLLETSGALLLHAALRDLPPEHGGWFEAVFHAISAFCNAGFSVYSSNAVALRESHLALWTIMGLIVAGGLGYTVLMELFARTVRAVRRRREGPVVWSLHSRVVLKASAVLIFGGALLLMLTGLTAGENTWGRPPHPRAVSIRNGTHRRFNSLDIGRVPVPSLLILIALMFIGGSPGSCAGGIKTTTATVWAARVRARLSGRSEVTIGERRVPHDVVRRAALVISIATLWNLAGVFLLATAEIHAGGPRLEQLIFEQISAFGTVGLSANAGAAVSLSGTFTAVGKLWIIATMFVGRVGPLTLALAVISTPRPLYDYPSERVMIG